jgi:membrane-bound lytic murein transglycosylase
MKKRTQYTVWLAMGFAGTVMISGCSSQPKTWNEIQQAHREAQQQQAKAVASSMPDWFINPPKDNAEYVYASAVGRSFDPNIAKNIAQTALHGQIANKVEMSTDMTQDQVIENTQAQSQQATQTLNQRTTQTSSTFNLPTAYEEVKREMVYEEGQFIVYLLARYPVAQYRLNKQSQNNNDASIPKSFDKKIEQLHQRKQENNS